MWLMRSLPGQLEENLPRGSGVFLTVDVIRLPELFNPSFRKPERTVQRKEKGDNGVEQISAPQSVHKEIEAGYARPLEPKTKELMESRFGQDFSR